jgi:hypothetical protein
MRGYRRMNKKPCVAAILFALIVSAGHHSSAAPIKTFSYPVVVATGRLVNQTAPIQPTTIFTPNQDGIYRLSVYGTLTRADATSNSVWYVGATWNDDAGSQNADSILGGISNIQGQFSTYDFFGGSGGPSVVFEAKASTPIAYYVSGTPDNSEYSLYYALERLK